MANTKKEIVSEPVTEESAVMPEDAPLEIPADMPSTTEPLPEPQPAPAVSETAEEPTFPLQVKQNLPLNMMVACTNMTHGKLIYNSKKQAGYQVIWEKFGDVEYLELNELVSMRNSAPKFFRNNWVWIDDPMVLKFLNVGAYYQHALSPDSFDGLFRMAPAALEKAVQPMTGGLKLSVAIRAIELIQSGELDSRKRIKALENALGYTLLED